MSDYFKREKAWTPSFQTLGFESSDGATVYASCVCIVHWDQGFNCCCIACVLRVFPAVISGMLCCRLKKNTCKQRVTNSDDYMVRAVVWTGNNGKGTTGSKTEGSRMDIESAQMANKITKVADG